jgi:2'-5' RNA ligase
MGRKLTKIDDNDSSIFVLSSIFVVLQPIWGFNAFSSAQLTPNSRYNRRMEAQRLFIAITLSADLLVALTSAQRQLQRKLAAQPLRWARPEGIHLTLKFLGDTDPARIPDITDALSRAAAKHAPFELPVGGLGMFPNAKRPTVLWVGVHDEAHHLRRLAAGVDKALARLGWQREKRAFNGHLTLARVKKQTGNRDRRALGEAVSGLQGYQKLGILPVQSISIMRSQLRPGGARYTEVRKIELSGRSKP